MKKMNRTDLRDVKVMYTSFQGDRNRNTGEEMSVIKIKKKNIRHRVEPSEEI